MSPHTLILPALSVVLPVLVAIFLDRRSPQAPPAVQRYPWPPRAICVVFGLFDFGLGVGVVQQARGHFGSEE